MARYADGSNIGFIIGDTNRVSYFTLHGYVDHILVSFQFHPTDLANNGISGLLHHLTDGPVRIPSTLIVSKFK